MTNREKEMEVWIQDAVDLIVDLNDAVDHHGQNIPEDILKLISDLDNLVFGESID